MLHGAALVPAQRANVNVRLLDVNDPEGPGTMLATHTRGEGPVGIAARKKLVRIDLDLSGTDDRNARMAEFFDALRRHNIAPGPISSTAETLSVFVPPSAAVEALLCDFGARARTQSELALVALIGRSIGWDTALWQRAMSVFASEGIEVSEAFVGSRSPSQVFVVAAADLERAVQALHAGLFRPIELST